jgi:nicotinamidase-related amidase
MLKEIGWQRDLHKYPRLAPDFELEPKRTALLIIDMQYSDAHADYGLGLLLKDKYPEAASYYFQQLADVVIPNQSKLIDLFRRNSLKIIYITLGPMLSDASDFLFLKRERQQEIEKETGRKSVLHHYGSFEHGILEEIKPQEGELVINKTSAGAFNSTAIDQTLRNMGVEGLVIIGVVTHACVESTARDAADRGYKCILVDDACTTFSQEYHDATLRTFAMHFGKVQTTEETIDYLQKRVNMI